MNMRQVPDYWIDEMVMTYHAVKIDHKIELIVTVQTDEMILKVVVCSDHYMEYNVIA